VPPTLQVLIIEDDVSFALELSDLLEKEGWHAERETDGVQALGRLRRAPTPDLVLLDLNLPGVSGWGIYGELMLNPLFPKVPVLMVTAASHFPAEIPLKNVLGILEKPSSRGAWEHFRIEVRRQLQLRAAQVLAAKA
jgi:CheY-like chemotaxis protein